MQTGNFTNAIDSGGTAHLIGHRQQGLTSGAIHRINKRQALRAQIPRRTRFRIPRKIAIVDVLHKLRGRRIAQVIHRNAANPLQTHKSMGLAVDLTHHNGFGLRPLVVAAVIKGIFVVGAVEKLRIRRQGNPL